MNRTRQLKATLGENCRVISAFKGRVEWVIVNFCRSDTDAAFAEADQYIRQHAAEQIKKGWVRYITTSLATWNAGICKNVSGFCACGDYIINLDIDNIISIKDTVHLLGLASDLMKTLYHGWDGQWKTGTCGMVGVPRHVWFAIGGYYEERVGVGFEDFDLLLRAQKQSGYGVERFCNRRVIENTDEERTAASATSGEDLHAQKVRNRQHCLARIDAGQIRCVPQQSHALSLYDIDGHLIKVYST